MRRTLPPLFALAALITLVTALAAADGPAPKKPKVKLAVLVFFDQMRGDYVEKWRPHFGEAGFKRLQADGAWFADCHYPYGTTTTAPGHASVPAGCSGDRHGVINNNWFDRATGAEIYSAGSTRYELVPPKALDEEAIDPKTPSTKPKPPAVGNPDRLLGPTLADVLKETTGNAGKVFGVSLKDRSAIFPAGRKPDGAYWFNGRFVTSTYYRDSLPPWVSKFNDSGLAEGYFGKTWNRLRADLDYDKFAGPDDGPGEASGPTKAKTMGKVFPHPMTGGQDKVGAAYYQDMVCSPYGNELLLAFAKDCVTNEKLGQDDVPDLLSISFSSNDLVGHAWGPDSHEVLDVTLRSDLIVADLLKFLDEKVGPGNYSLVVTADHGISPIPPVTKRIPPIAILKGAETHLRAAYGQADDAKKAGEKADDAKKDRNLWIEAVSAPNVYLNRKQVKAAGLEPDAVAESLAGWLRTQPGIERAYTAKQLRGDTARDDVYFSPTRKSFHPERSGDVVLVTKPYYLLDSYTSGTSHGTPHDYDTHAVFLVYGPGVAGGRRDEKVTPLHAAAILADFLGLAPPRNNEYALPATLAKP